MIEQWDTHHEEDRFTSIVDKSERRDREGLKEEQEFIEHCFANQDDEEEADLKVESTSNYQVHHMP
jgi:hypothetical protein